ncbi:coiled-coil domain-containing protein 86-like [Mytilus edulis]|uniref:coiled-coil domain-containing protein 86-like n=1 Tax=Mytilus edulis TaxID=6550 RepID=UPI0039EFF081
MSELKKKSENPENITRGKPKSGRVWKNVQNQRFSDIKQVKSFKSSWSDKMKKKAEKKSVMDFEKRLKDEKNREKEDRRQRKVEKEKRRVENQRKSEIVQPIKNTAKIKRMKKKQLRLLEKR